MGCGSSTPGQQQIAVNPRDLRSIPVNKSPPYRHGSPITIVSYLKSNIIKSISFIKMFSF